MTTNITLRTYTNNPATTRFTSVNNQHQRPYPLIDTTVDETALSPQARALLSYTSVFGFGDSKIRIRSQRTNREIVETSYTPERAARVVAMYGEEWGETCQVTTINWWPNVYQYNRPAETPEAYLERLVAWLNDDGWEVVIPA